jgi:hypothetical protein
MSNLRSYCEDIFLDGEIVLEAFAHFDKEKAREISLLICNSKESLTSSNFLFMRFALKLIKDDFDKVLNTNKLYINVPNSNSSNNIKSFILNMLEEEEKCVAGCNVFHGGEIRHHSDCPFYPESLSQKYDEMEIENCELKKRIKND